tara:strand:+ start:197 stop:547 length:351 start_codon:yes stop_codon:yes gene_type:complete
MIDRKIIALSVVAALTACSSGVDQAKKEMADACFRQANGRLTESECGCMADKAFASLDEEERAFVEKLYKLDPGTPDAEAAEQLGMDRSEFKRLSRNFRKKLAGGAVNGAMECVGA